MSVQMFCRDAIEVFLKRNSVNLFFMNPSYLGSRLAEYGGPIEGHTNNVETIAEYLENQLKLIKHAEYALTNWGSILVMVQNDANIAGRLSHLVETQTELKVGQMYVWDFSRSGLGGSQNEFPQMGIILHFYKGNHFYLNPEYRRWIFDIPVIKSEIEKYEDLGFVGSTLPEELYGRILLMFSKQGDVVADLVGGTGNIIIAARKLRRDVIYNDISETQYQIALARNNDYHE